MGNQQGQGVQQAQPPPQDQAQGQGQIQGQLHGQGRRPIFNPVRDYRPRRIKYNDAQRARAVRLLDMGIPCRQVARMIGPRCSSGSPIRWRQQARRQAEARRRLEELMRRR